MIRALQRKFILTAMLSLLILIIILIGSITVLSYYQIEANSDATLTMLSNDTPYSNRGAEPPRPVFGYRINPTASFPSGSFTAHATVDGNINFIRIMGIAELGEDEATELAQEVLTSGKESGKTGAYKYRVTEIDQGGLRIVFVDNSAQIRMLLDTFSLSCFVGLGCMVLMFFILLLLSGRAIRPIAVNMEKQKQFVTNAGHEIKTPLAIIMANVDALELKQGESKYSGNIRSQAERMNGLMKQLLLLAKADEGSAGFISEPVDLSALAKNNVAAFTEPAKQKGITIQAEIADGITVPGSVDHLEMLLGILLDNAVKYNRTGGTVALSLTAEGRKCRLWITNSTEALPDVPPDAIFDRFYRADTARTQKNGGYGIGLSAAKSIIQIHSGKIDASYQPPHTICFTVELPL